MRKGIATTGRITIEGRRKNMEKKVYIKCVNKETGKVTKSWTSSWEDFQDTIMNGQGKIWHPEYTDEDLKWVASLRIDESKSLDVSHEVTPFLKEKVKERNEDLDLDDDDVYDSLRDEYFEISYEDNDGNLLTEEDVAKIYVERINEIIADLKKKKEAK